MSKIDDIMTALDYYLIEPATRHDPTEDELKQFEDDLGGQLPPDYRTFLRHYGCTGLGKGARFTIKEPNPWGASGSIDYFFGFSTVSSMNVVNVTMTTYAGRIPDETIPIGSDPGGNLILLGFDTPVTNHVFFWDHENRELNNDYSNQLTDQVEAEVTDANQSNIHRVISYSQQAHREQRTKSLGFKNLYTIGDSFIEFLESLHPAYS